MGAFSFIKNCNLKTQVTEHNAAFKKVCCQNFSNMTSVYNKLKEIHS